MIVWLRCQAAIRKELNEFKSAEMEVHEESKKFTRCVQLIIVSNVMIIYCTESSVVS